MKFQIPTLTINSVSLGQDSETEDGDEDKDKTTTKERREMSEDYTKASSSTLDVSEPALVGGSLLTPEMAQLNMRRKRKMRKRGKNKGENKKKKFKKKTSRNQFKVLENSANKLERKLEIFQDKDRSETHLETQIGNLNSN